MTSALMFAALSAAVSGGVSYGMLRAALKYIEAELARIATLLASIDAKTTTHAIDIAVLKVTSTGKFQAQ